MEPIWHCRRPTETKSEFCLKKGKVTRKGADLDVHDKVEIFLILRIMPITKVQKEEILKALVENMKQAKSVVFADYQGMSVKEVKEMRSKMREKGVSFQVAKKTLLKLAAKEAGYSDEIPVESILGPIGAAFSMEDELAAAKMIHEISKKNDKLKLRGALFEGKALSVAQTKQLAMLPSKEELISKFIYVIKSPIQGFHGVLNNTVAGFVRVLNAIKEKQEQGA